FRCVFPERRGHGHTADVDGPITVEVMATDTIMFLERIIGRPMPLIGYSAGAIVALWVAVRRPDLVDKLVLLSGAFDRDGMIPGTSHLLLHEKPELCAKMVLDFLTNRPVPTLMPIRRSVRSAFATAPGD